MDLLSAILCAFVLFAAAVLEIITMKDRTSGFLASFGFLMLGTRYFYLIAHDDIGRLHIIGTGSIVAIATARIIACAGEIRGD